MVTKSGSHARHPKKVAANGRKRGPVKPANGAEVSAPDREVLRNLYAAVLKCRMLARQPQESAAGRNPASDHLFPFGHEAIIAGISLALGAEGTMIASCGKSAARIAKPTWLPHLLEQSQRGAPATVAPELPPAGTPDLDPFNLVTGIAQAQGPEKNGNVVVALCIDGSSSHGRWREAMKLAAIHKLPVIFVLETDSPFEREAAKRNPALEEVSFTVRDCGFPAIIVDGHDAVAVWRVTQESIHRARQGAGPTLIECDSELSSGADPLAHLEHYMRKRGDWNEEWRRSTAAQIEADIAAMKVPGADGG